MQRVIFHLKYVLFNIFQVDIDFKSLYPQCNTILSNSLEEHHSNLINLMNDKIKDSASRVLLESIKSEQEISESNTLIYLNL